MSCANQQKSSPKGRRVGQNCSDSTPWCNVALNRPDGIPNICNNISDRGEGVENAISAVNIVKRIKFR